MASTLVLLFVLLFPFPDEADDQYRFVVGLCEKGMYELAVDEAESFLKQHRGHAKEPYARYRLAIALFELQRPADAAPHFRKLVSDPKFEFAAEVSFRLGQCELEAGRYDAAISTLQLVLKQTGRKYLHLPASFLLGEAAFRKQDYEAARDYYDSVLTEKQNNEYEKDARYGAAWCSFRLGDYDRALSDIDRFAAQHRGDPLEGELLFLAGECHLEVGRPAEAVKTYGRVGDGPFLDSALRGAGFALAEMNDHAAAAKTFGALVQRFPTSRYVAEATLQCGIHLLKAGDARSAIEVLSSPTAEVDVDLLYWRSRARQADGKLEAALTDIENALARKPDAELSERCQVVRGDLLFDLGRTSDAASAYGKSESDYALHSAATACLNEQRFDDAEKLARQFLERWPDSPYIAATQVILGECLLSAKNYTRAAAEFDRAARATGDRELKVRAISRMAWCQFLGGDVGAAAGRFQWVVDNGSGLDERAESLYMLGRSQESAQQSKDAIRSWRRYLSEYPDGAHRPDVLIGLARLEPGESGAARLDELLTKHSGHEGAPQALYRLAEQLQAQEKTQQAEQQYRKILERYPGSEVAAPAQYGLAWCLYERGEFAESAAQLRALGGRSKVAKGLHAAGIELLVWAERDAGNLPGMVQAFHRYRQVCSDQEKLLNIARAAALTLTEKGQTKDADTLLRSLEDSRAGDDLSAGILVERTYLSLEQNDVDSAETQVKKAIRRAPADADAAEAAFFVAEALFELQKDARAVPLYSHAAGTDGCPVIDRALYKEGFARMRQNDLEGAAQSFADLTANHRNSNLYGESLFLQAEMCYRLDRMDQAIACLKTLRRDAPNHDVTPRALFRLGLALCRTAEWKDGEAVLTELVRRHKDFPNIAEAELWRGRALAARNNDRGARQAFDRVLAHDRGVLAARARLELGKLHYRGGDAEKALSEFLKVAVLYGHEAEVAEGLYLAGQCLEKIGDRGRARTQYQEIVQKYPRSTFAEDARKRIEELKAF